ncbi:hypothetical protein [Pseudonocardia sp. KRD291]|uniref:hypothetical protein n=1 Tax=Pseudonocardia sp. KRD291 TaxID=2792007 RepID=UPI0027E2F22C|nr:hypothetical protein [Pseudonocardia sp. KRD291]
MLFIGGTVVVGHIVTDPNGPHGEAALNVAFTADLDTATPAITPVEPATLPDAPGKLTAAFDPGPTDAAAAEILRQTDGQAIARQALQKATGLAGERAATAKQDAERAAARARTEQRDEPEQTAQDSSQCAERRSGFGAVSPEVGEVGEDLRCRFDISTVYGVAGRSNASDHPKGRALDFMADRSSGDALADYATQNLQRLGISYVIYRQRINFGEGWETMEDRGGVTANHMDHVHMSFE